MFHLNPESEGRWDFLGDIYANKFLFWSVIIGALSVFPVVYIPFLNTDFFKHMGITWEWALAVGMVFVFVGGIELWKFIKRRLRLLEDRPVNRGSWGQGENDEDYACVRKTLTMSSFKTWASFGRRDTTERAGEPEMVSAQDIAQQQQGV
jgi:hypothetical protein